MRDSKSQNLLLTILLFICNYSLYGQKLEPKIRTLLPDTSISSKIMGRDYQLYISFPGGYSNKDTIRYPVLYVLDAKRTFPIVSAARTAMDLSNELEKVIIVCITSGLDGTSIFINRNYDYTPSEDTASNSGNEITIEARKGTIHSGGAEKFLQCMTKEIFPYIDKHYKTTSDRGICGHSLGGLFAAYCLLHSKGVFTRYAISSPSLWWNHDEVLNQADSLFTNNETWDIPPTKVFISVGQKEGVRMLPETVRFATMLEDRAYKNVTLTWHIFEDETHFSVWPASLSRTLSVLYGVKK